MQPAGQVQGALPSRPEVEKAGTEEQNKELYAFCTGCVEIAQATRGGRGGVRIGSERLVVHELQYI